jgi:hypothetical protein
MKTAAVLLCLAWLAVAAGFARVWWINKDKGDRRDD